MTRYTINDRRRLQISKNVGVFSSRYTWAFNELTVRAFAYFFFHLLWMLSENMNIVHKAPFCILSIFRYFVAFFQSIGFFRPSSFRILKNFGLTKSIGNYLIENDSCSVSIFAMETTYIHKPTNTYAHRPTHTHTNTPKPEHRTLCINIIIFPFYPWIHRFSFSCSFCSLSQEIPFFRSHSSQPRKESLWKTAAYMPMYFGYFKIFTWFMGF